MHDKTISLKNVQQIINGELEQLARCNSCPDNICMRYACDGVKERIRCLEEIKLKIIESVLDDE